MKRLTIRNSDGSVSQPMDLKWAEALDKLAAYEDTGLEPEEVEDTLYRFSSILCEMTNNRMSKTGYTVEAMRSMIEDVRLEECDLYCNLKQAEAEGRMVILPCKVGNDDLISRQAAIEYLVTNMCWYDEEGEQAEYDEKVAAITDLINGVPSVDRPKGKWIYTSDCSGAGYPVERCSVCGCEWEEAGWNFCPNCGADMRGEQE